MSLTLHGTGAGSHRSKRRFSLNLHGRRSRRGLGNARHLVGRDVGSDAPRRQLRVWLIPGLAVGAVFAALAIVHVRVELIGQGYKRYSAVERLQALEEEQRNLTARVEALRDPARLATLAREMGLARPDRVIALTPSDSELRP
jgi:hypothetical protein